MLGVFRCWGGGGGLCYTAGRDLMVPFPKGLQRSVTTGRTDRARAGDGAMARGRRAGSSARRFLMRADWAVLLLLAILAAAFLWLSFFPLTQRSFRLAEAPGW